MIKKRQLQKKKRKIIYIFLILGFYLLFNPSLIQSNCLKEQQYDLNSSQSENPDFKILAPRDHFCVRGFSNRGINWQFSSSNPLIEISVAVIREDFLEYFLQDPENFNTYTGVQGGGGSGWEGLMCVVFLNADPDLMTTIVIYNVEFETENSNSLNQNNTILESLMVTLGVILFLIAIVIAARDSKKEKRSRNSVLYQKA
jgi:hypothetical protein